MRGAAFWFTDFLYAEPRASGRTLPRYTAIAPDVESAVVYSIARQESGFNAKAVSSAHALGLMQVTPEAGRFIAKKFNVAYDERRLLWVIFLGHPTEDLTLAQPGLGLASRVGCHLRSPDYRSSPAGLGRHAAARAAVLMVSRVSAWARWRVLASPSSIPDGGPAAIGTRRLAGPRRGALGSAA